MVAALMLILSYFAPYVDPNRFWQFGVLGLIFPFMIFVNLFFILLWMLLKPVYASISLITIFLGWNSFSGIIGLKLPTNIQENEQEIRVMTYNIRALSKLVRYPTNNFAQNKEKFAFFIEENKQPHVMCLQETTIPNIEFFKTKLGYRNIVRHPGPNSKTAILSMYPIENHGLIQFEEGNGSCVWADIELDGNKVRFYSVHLHSNTISVQADTLIKVENINNEKALKGLNGMFKKYKFASNVRQLQATKLKNHMESSPYPVVLCGDFNDTPQSFIYQILSDGMTDAFKARGIGFGTTWAGNLPGLKIDYILTDANVEVLSNSIYRRKFSDHYPMMTALLFK